MIRRFGLAADRRYHARSARGTVRRANSIPRGLDGERRRLSA
jgi:hypothetical protein